jgi:hypothetical protein
VRFLLFSGYDKLNQDIIIKATYLTIQLGSGEVQVDSESIGETVYGNEQGVNNSCQARGQADKKTLYAEDQSGKSGSQSNDEVLNGAQVKVLGDCRIKKV